MVLTILEASLYSEEDSKFFKLGTSEDYIILDSILSLYYIHLDSVLGLSMYFTVDWLSLYCGYICTVQCNVAIYVRCSVLRLSLYCTVNCGYLYTVQCTVAIYVLYTVLCGYLCTVQCTVVMYVLYEGGTEIRP